MKDFEINYIDNLWISLRSIDKRLNLTITLQTFLSLIYIFLVFGITSIDNKYSLLGAHFTITPWLIFASGIILLNILFIYLWSLNEKSNLLQKELHKFYIKNNISTFNNKFRFSDSFITLTLDIVIKSSKSKVMLIKLLSHSFVFLLSSSILILPIFAIATMTYQLLSLIYLHIFLWIPILIISFVITLITPISFFLFIVSATTESEQKRIK